MIKWSSIFLGNGLNAKNNLLQRTTLKVNMNLFIRSDDDAILVDVGGSGVRVLEGVKK